MAIHTFHTEHVGVSINGGTISYHPFLDGIFPEIQHPAIGVPGTPMAMTPPYYTHDLWKPPYMHIIVAQHRQHLPCHAPGFLRWLPSAQVGQAVGTETWARSGCGVLT